MKRRKRWWPSAIAVWVALVVVGGLLTLYLQGGEGTAADPGSPPSDTPSATYKYIPCPSPTENEERTVRACAYKLEN